jgi:hypothetical protein
MAVLSIKAVLERQSELEKTLEFIEAERLKALAEIDSRRNKGIEKTRNRTEK